MRPLRPLLLILALAAIAPAAEAGNPLYLTAKAGNTSVDIDPGSSFRQLIDGDDNSWSLGLGLRLGRHLAFQAEYLEFGQVPGRSRCPERLEVCIALLVPIEAESTAVAVSVLPQLPVTDRFSVYGKVGVVSRETDIFTVTDAGKSFIDDFEDEDLVYGAGVRVLLPGPFGLFAEYERLGDNIDTVAFGATLGY